MRTSGVILMTALLPTNGHKALIDFAYEFARGMSQDRVIDDLDVIISARTFEPIPGIDRVQAFRNTFFENRRIRIHLHLDDDAPQNPSTEKEWKYWTDICKKFTKGNQIKLFFASEPYGKVMADRLGVEFVPYDIDRTINPVKGSDVRKLPAGIDILDDFRKFYLHTNIIIFGAESCGKTTATKALHNWLNTKYGSFRNRRQFANMTTEFARPYLEMMDDKTVTPAKMRMIELGQVALQNNAWADPNVLATVADTDILSTIGYYRLYQGQETESAQYLFADVRGKNDLYIVMNDGIPFEPDPLRYGGDVRESNTQFWIDLLEEYDCNYYVVTNTDRSLQYAEINAVVKEHLDNIYLPIMEFKRD